MSSGFPLYFSGMISTSPEMSFQGQASTAVPIRATIDNSSIELLTDITQAFNNTIQEISSTATMDLPAQDVNEITSIINDESSIISNSLNDATTLLTDLQNERDEILQEIQNISNTPNEPGAENVISVLEQDLVEIDEEMINILTEVLSSVEQSGAVIESIVNDIAPDAASISTAPPNEIIEAVAGAAPEVVEAAADAINAEDEAIQSAEVAQQTLSLDIATQAAADATQAASIASDAAQLAQQVTTEEVVTPGISMQQVAHNAWVAYTAATSAVQAKQAAYAAAQAATQLAAQRVAQLSASGANAGDLAIAEAQLQTAMATEEVAGAEVTTAQTQALAQLQAADSAARAAQAEMMAVFAAEQEQAAAQQAAQQAADAAAAQQAAQAAADAAAAQQAAAQAAADAVATQQAAQAAADAAAAQAAAQAAADAAAAQQAAAQAAADAAAQQVAAQAAADAAAAQQAAQAAADAAAAQLAAQAAAQSAADAAAAQVAAQQAAAQVAAQQAAAQVAAQQAAQVAAQSTTQQAALTPAMAALHLADPAAAAEAQAYPREQFITWRDQAQGNLTQVQLNNWNPPWMYIMNALNIPWTHNELVNIEGVNNAKTGQAARIAQYGYDQSNVHINWIQFAGLWASVSVGRFYSNFQLFTVLNTAPTTTVYLRVIFPEGTTNFELTAEPSRSYITGLPNIQVPFGTVSMIVSLQINAHSPVPNNELTTITARINNDGVARHYVTIKVVDAFSR